MPKGPRLFLLWLEEAPAMSAMLSGLSEEARLVARVFLRRHRIRHGSLAQAEENRGPDEHSWQDEPPVTWRLTLKWGGKERYAEARFQLNPETGKVEQQRVFWRDQDEGAVVRESGRVTFDELDISADFASYMRRRFA